MPLTYALTLHACLRDHHRERPTFAQVIALLEGVMQEVATGEYVDLAGEQRVRPAPVPPLTFCMYALVLHPKRISPCILTYPSSPGERMLSKSCGVVSSRPVNEVESILSSFCNGSRMMGKPWYAGSHGY